MVTIYAKYYGPCPRKQLSQTEHALGLSLLSGGLKELYQLEIPADELPNHLAFAGNQKPYLKDYPQIHHNISHSDGLVVCAFSDHTIGVDVEKIHPFSESIFRKVLTEKEKAFLEAFRDQKEKYEEVFYRFWTLKESRIKQSGLGLAMPLTDFSFEFDLSGELPAITCSDAGLFFYQQLLTSGHVLSVCSDAPVGTPRLQVSEP